MSEPESDETDVDARLQQMRGRRVAHNMRRNAFVNQARAFQASLIDGLLEDVIDAVARQLPAAMTGKRDRRASALQFMEPRLQYLGRV